MPGIVETLNLKDDDELKKFYEKLKSNEANLKSSFGITFPATFEAYKADVKKKSDLAEKLQIRKQKLNEIQQKYDTPDLFANRGVDGERIFSMFLKLDGDDAEEENAKFMEMFKNDIPGYTKFLTDKLLAIDTKKLLADMAGKTDDELAQMYYNNPEPYYLGFVAADIINKYGKYMEPGVLQQLNDNLLDYQNLVVPMTVSEKYENELYAYIPEAKLVNDLEPKAESVTIKGIPSQINDSINSYLIAGSAAEFQKIMPYHEDIRNKIDKLIAACEDSEKASWKNSKLYGSMKEALDDFKNDWSNPDKHAKACEKLRNSAEKYLVYKSKNTMKPNAQGKVAAAAGILELLDEIDAHKKDSKTVVKPFEKGEGKNPYEERAVLNHKKYAYTTLKDFDNHRTFAKHIECRNTIGAADLQGRNNPVLRKLSMGAGIAHGESTDRYATDVVMYYRYTHKDQANISMTELVESGKDVAAYESYKAFLAENQIFTLDEKNNISDVIDPETTKDKCKKLADFRSFAYKNIYQTEPFLDYSNVEIAKENYSKAIMPNELYINISQNEEPLRACHKGIMVPYLKSYPGKFEAFEKDDLMAGLTADINSLVVSLFSENSQIEQKLASKVILDYMKDMYVGKTPEQIYNEGNAKIIRAAAMTKPLIYEFASEYEGSPKDLEDFVNGKPMPKAFKEKINNLNLQIGEDIQNKIATMDAIVDNSRQEFIDGTKAWDVKYNKELINSKDLLKEEGIAQNQHLTKVNTMENTKDLGNEKK